MKMRFITVNNQFRNGCYLVYFPENLCPVVIGIIFETTMDRLHSKVGDSCISKK